MTNARKVMALSIALLTAVLSVSQQGSSVQEVTTAVSTPTDRSIDYAYLGQHVRPAEMDKPISREAATPPTTQPEEPTPTRSKPASNAKPNPPVIDYSSMEPCGGDLPPCFVKKRESGGNYGAYNPTGCVWRGGRGCYGAWQFGTMWAGKLGLPEDLSTATPAQQDEAARQLWNGGAGCGNWAAC